MVHIVGPSPQPPLLGGGEHVAHPADAGRGETLLAQHHGGESPRGRIAAPQQGGRDPHHHLPLVAEGDHVEGGLGLLPGAVGGGQVDRRIPALDGDGVLPAVALLEGGVAAGDEHPNAAARPGIGIDVDVEGLHRKPARRPPRVLDAGRHLEGEDDVLTLGPHREGDQVVAARHEDGVAGVGVAAGAVVVPHGIRHAEQHQHVGDVGYLRQGGPRRRQQGGAGFHLGQQRVPRLEGAEVAEGDGGLEAPVEGGGRHPRALGRLHHLEPGRTQHR